MNLILDTNVVLDWLVFRDRRSTWLGPAIESGRAVWYQTAAMRQELEHVLTRSHIAARHGAPKATTAALDQWALAVAPSPMPLTIVLRCTDPDDQVFIDLAWQMRPATLLSRDRAVLRLARRACLHGVSICLPDAPPPAFGNDLSG